MLLPTISMKIKIPEHPTNKVQFYSKHVFVKYYVICFVPFIPLKTYNLISFSLSETHIL